MLRVEVDLKKRSQDSLGTAGVAVTSGAGSRKMADVRTATIQFLQKGYGDAVDSDLGIVSPSTV
ncbi:MAG: hypothetical protein L7W43_02045 [Rubripirellula sp.]|nr:hypothetical protein [Rubripirellula sp.]